MKRSPLLALAALALAVPAAEAQLAPADAQPPTARGGGEAAKAAVERLTSEQGVETRTLRGLEGPAAMKGVRRLEITTYGPEKDVLPGVGSHLFRSSYVDVEPGGVVAVHPHADRPAFLQIVSGTIMLHKSDGASHEMGPGDFTAASDQLAHWWENRGDETVRIWVADLCDAEHARGCEPGMEAGATAVGSDDGATLSESPEGERPSVERMAAIDLVGEFPDAVHDGIGNRVMRLRRVEIAPGGAVPAHAQAERPNYFRITEGELRLHTPEGARTLKEGTVVLERGTSERAFENPGDGAVVLHAVHIVDPDA
ncbi:MAG: cupin domain-containing protein [Paracoccaceae bacterium]